MDVITKYTLSGLIKYENRHNISDYLLGHFTIINATMSPWRVPDAELGVHDAARRRAARAGPMGAIMPDPRLSRVLSAAAEIVGGFGGHIGVTSIPGEGLIFTFTARLHSEGAGNGRLND
jgi:hypothetical protein